jgi:hypothetical protein
MPATVRAASAIVWLVVQLTACESSVAAPVPARWAKGSARAYLVLRDAQARVIAQGDWWQIPHDDQIEVHLRFDFGDGSLSHETYVLSQRRVWTMLSYSSEQRGPSFPRDMTAQIDRGSGRYTVRTKDRDGGDVDVDEGRIEIPEDAYPFGPLALLLADVKPGETISAHAIAFTPKPRVLKLTIAPGIEDGVAVEGTKRKIRRYVVNAKVEGLLGVGASILGKQPPDMHYWLSGDPMPTFLRTDGPLYAEGPIWHVELAAPDWSRGTPDR